MSKSPITIDNIILCEDSSGTKKYIVGYYDDTYDDSYAEYCGHFYSFHPKYFIGEEHVYHSLPEFWSDFYKKLNMNCPDTISECEDIAFNLDDYCFVPVYATIHGSIYLSSTDPCDQWDSCRVGFIYCSKEDYDKYFLKKDSEDWKFIYKNYAFDWIEEENDVMNGQTYGFIIADFSELDEYRETVEKLYSTAWRDNLRQTILSHEENDLCGFHGDYEKLLLEFMKDEGFKLVDVL